MRRGERRFDLSQGDARWRTAQGHTRQVEDGRRSGHPQPRAGFQRNGHAALGELQRRLRGSAAATAACCVGGKLTKGFDRSTASSARCLSPGAMEIAEKFITR
jgi:hypothetical protein